MATTTLKEGLRNALNEVREVSSNSYQTNVPYVEEDTPIELFSGPLLNLPKLLNEFCEGLVQRIVYTQYEIKAFRNPLKILEGDEMPLGYIRARNLCKSRYTEEIMTLLILPDFYKNMKVIQKFNI